MIVVDTCVSLLLCCTHVSVRVRDKQQRVAGLKFKDICPGNDDDRQAFITRQFAGTQDGFSEMCAAAKTMGVRYLPIQIM